MTGEELRAIAAELKLPQADVARRLGYGQASVSDWFRGVSEAPELVVHIFRCPQCRKHFLLDGKL